MPNLIAALIITVALLLGIKIDFPVNPLLGLGLIAVCGYFLSLFCRPVGIPAPLCYIGAGMLLGYNGLGILPEHFPDSVVFIESLCIMLLTIDTARFVFHSEKLPILLPMVNYSVITTILIAVFTAAFLAVLRMPQGIIVLGAISTTLFSPLSSFCAHRGDTASFTTVSFSLFGFALAVVSWGAVIPFLHHESAHTIRFAFLPSVTVLTSLIVGVALSYAGDRFFQQSNRKINAFLPFALAFLLFPLVRVAGFDYPFSSAGIGIYFGLLSETKTANDTRKSCAEIAAFGLLGCKLPLFGVFVLEHATIIYLFYICALFFIVRFIVFGVLSKISRRRFSNGINTADLMAFGPLSFFMLTRLFHGIPVTMFQNTAKETLETMMNTSIAIIFILSAALHVNIRRWSKIKSAVETQ